MAPDQTLIVIDMQPDGFPLARSVIKPVLSLMEERMLRGHGLVLVRYLCNAAGEIAPAILAAATGYSRLLLVDKTAEDGSSEILSACTAGGLSLERLLVCGVTTDDCISKTAHGLAHRLSGSQVDVVKHACECWQGKRYDWSRFSTPPNLRAV